MIKSKAYQQYFIDNLRMSDLAESYHFTAERLGIREFAELCVKLDGVNDGFPGVLAIKRILYSYIRQQSKERLSHIASDLGMHKRYVAAIWRG